MTWVASWMRIGGVMIEHESPLVLNRGDIVGMSGDWYRESSYGYEVGADAAERMLTDTEEAAHLEALDGLIAQLQTREDFMAQTGSWPEEFVKGYREARYKAMHVRGELAAHYKFAKKKREKRAVEIEAEVKEDRGW